MKGFCLYASFLSWLYLCLLFSIFHSVIPNICISETFHSYRTKVTKSVDCHAIMWKKMYLYSQIMAECHGCSEMDWLYMVCRGVLSQVWKVSGRRCHIDYVVLVSRCGHDIVDPVPPEWYCWPCSTGLQAVGYSIRSLSLSCWLRLSFSAVSGTRQSVRTRSLQDIPAKRRDGGYWRYGLR